MVSAKPKSRGARVINLLTGEAQLSVGLEELERVSIEKGLLKTSEINPRLYAKIQTRALKMKKTWVQALD